MTETELSSTVVLQTIDKLDYHQRVKYASKLGKENKNNPNLKKLVQELRVVPPAVTPHYETEEGFTEILPVQQNNTSHHYSSLHLSLSLSSSSGDVSTLSDELHSPSVFFKQLAATEFVRLQTSDDELYNEIITAVPFVRNKLIHAAISHKRKNLLDKIVPFLFAKYGFTSICGILHGCSSPVVERFLNDKNVIESKDLHWKIISRHHEEVLIRRLERLLSKAEAEDRINSVWIEWNDLTKDRKFGKVLLKSPRYVASLLQLALKFPATHATDTDVVGRHLPDAIIEKLKYFTKNYSKQIVEFIGQHSYISAGVLKGGIYAHQLDKLNANLTPEMKLELWKTIFAKSTTQTFLGLKNNLADLDDIEYLVFLSIDTRADYSLDGKLAQLLSQTLNDFSLDQVSKMIKLIKTVLYPMYMFPKRKGFLNTKQEETKLRSVFNDKITSIVRTILQHVREKATAALKKNPNVDLKRFEEVVNEVLKEFVFPNLSGYSADVIAGFWEYYQVQLPHLVTAQFFELIAPIFRNVSPENVVEEETWHSRAQSIMRKYKGSNPKIDFSVVKFFLEFAAKNPVKRKDLVSSLFCACDTSSERNEVFAVLLPILAQATSEPYSLLAVLKAVDKSTRINALQFLQEKIESKVFREYFVTLQDIEDHKVRSTLQKATDNSSATERIAAIKALVKCSFVDPNVTSILRTLSFIRKKLQNVDSEQRASGLQVLFEEANEETVLKVLKETKETITPVFDVYFQMLDDALQSPDLDSKGKSEFVNHPILKYFAKLSTKALYVGADKEEIFEFGAEIQWRVLLFRKGDKKAAESFFLDFGEKNRNLKSIFELAEKKLLSVQQFVDIYFRAYEKRIEAKHPNWINESGYYIPILKSGKKFWDQIPVLVQFLEKSLEQMKKTAERDDDGLLVIDGDADCVKMFAMIFKDWEKYPLLVSFMDTMIRSRLASQYIFTWKRSLENSAKSRKEKQQKRDQVVTTLLEITPSAIHLRFVQRHLVRWRQEMLDPYLLAKKTFRGVFYKPPKEDRIKTPKGRTRHGRKERGAKTSRPAAAGGKNQSKVADERAAENELTFETDEEDNREFFCLDLCYELRKLLPRQSEKLAEQWRLQLTNTNRSIVGRQHAARRLTIMPSMDYPDVLSILNSLDALPESQKVPVAIIDSLLKGTMYTSEPCAPLSFLLSLPFLSSPRSRIAIQVIAKLVPHMHDGAFAKILGGLLEGKRRGTLKVTTFKMIIRFLLQGVPDPVNIVRVITEFKKKDLHRDVKLTILQQSLNLLTDSKFGAMAWEVIEQAVKSNQLEVPIAILGALHGSIARELKSCCRRNKHRRAVSSLKKVTLAAEHREHFAKEVVWKLAAHANEDIKILAQVALGSWGKYGMSLDAADLTSSLLKIDLNHPAYNNGSEFETSLYMSRWKALARNLVRFCGLSNFQKYTTASPDLVQDLIQSIVDKYHDPAIEDNGAAKELILQQLKHVVELIPALGVKNKIFSAETEKALLAPLNRVKDMWEFIMKRKHAVIMEITKDEEPDLPYVKDFIESSLVYASRHPGFIRLVIDNVPSIIRHYKYSSLWTWLASLDDTNILPSLPIKIVYNCLSTTHTIFSNKSQLPILIDFIAKSFRICLNDSIPHSSYTTSLSDTAGTLVSNMRGLLKERDMRLEWYQCINKFMDDFLQSEEGTTVFKFGIKILTKDSDIIAAACQDKEKIHAIILKLIMTPSQNYSSNNNIIKNLISMEPYYYIQEIIDMSKYIDAPASGNNNNKETNTKNHAIVDRKVSLLLQQACLLITDTNSVGVKKEEYKRFPVVNPDCFKRLLHLIFSYSVFEYYINNNTYYNYLKQVFTNIVVNVAIDKLSGAFINAPLQHGLDLIKFLKSNSIIDFPHPYASKLDPELLKSVSQSLAIDFIEIFRRTVVNQEATIGSKTEWSEEIESEAEEMRKSDDLEIRKRALAICDSTQRIESRR